MAELFMKTDDAIVNNLADVETVRAQLNVQLKKMLTSERFIGKEDISRILLVNCFWISTLIDLPNDLELQ